LLKSPTLMAEIRSHNKEYAKEFHIGHVAEKYLSIFQEAVAESPSRS